MLLVAASSANRATGLNAQPPDIGVHAAGGKLLVVPETTVLRGSIRLWQDGCQNSNFGMDFHVIYVRFLPNLPDEVPASLCKRKRAGAASSIADP
jgi:hypothetical protein